MSLVTSDINLVFNSSTITMMHGPINIRFNDYNMRTDIKPVWNILIVNYITNSCIWSTCVIWQRYWLQAAWGWHDSAETFRIVIICEIIVRVLVIAQNTSDFCLWGWMNSEVYKTNVHTLYQLLARNLHAAARIKRREDQLRRTTRDLHTRVAKCTEDDGGIYEYSRIPV